MLHMQSLQEYSGLADDPTAVAALAESLAKLKAPSLPRCRSNSENYPALYHSDHYSSTTAATTTSMTTTTTTTTATTTATNHYH